MRRRLHLFRQVFQHNLPALCEHFEYENILPKSYIFDWFMTLYTRALNIDLVSHVWDLYLLDGVYIIYQTASGRRAVRERGR